MIIRIGSSRSWRLSAFCILGTIAIFAFAGCKRAEEQNSNVKKYTLNGTIVSVNAQAKSASIDAEEIPGFMMPMTMDYEIRDAGALAKLKPKDKITADLIVGPDGSYIEHVKVVGQASRGPN